MNDRQWEREQIREQLRVRRRKQLMLQWVLILVVVVFAGIALWKANKGPDMPADGGNITDDKVDKDDIKEPENKDPVVDNNDNTGNDAGDDTGNQGTDEGFCIVLDAGHGGTDPGTMWEDYQEKDITLSIAKKLETILTEAGYKVLMTRTGDDRTVYKDRVAVVDDNNADMFVSIHVNSYTDEDIKGVTTLYDSNENNQNERLAQIVQRHLLAKTGAYDMGLMLRDDLYVLNHTNVPACLVETGFLTSPIDRANLLDDAYQQKVAEGVANGIIEFLGE